MKKDISFTKFKMIYIEISNVCNLQCDFCPVVTRQKTRMSLEDFENTIQKVKNYTEQVAFHQMGDPLTHPHLKECLDICLNHQVRVNLTTNATRLKFIDKKILQHQAIRQINFSLQSFEFDKSGQSFDEYWQEIVSFTKSCLKFRPDLYINYRLWNDGLDNINNSDIFKKVERDFSVIVNPNVDVSFKKSKKILGKLYLNFDSRFEWPSMAASVLNTKGFCHALSSQMAIQANGDVIPCCLDSQANLKLGNVFNTPLLEILNSKRAVNIKTGFQKGERREELCKRCGFIERFQKKVS